MPYKMRRATLPLPPRAAASAAASARCAAAAAAFAADSALTAAAAAAFAALVTAGAVEPVQPASARTRATITTPLSFRITPILPRSVFVGGSRTSSAGALRDRDTPTMDRPQARRREAEGRDDFPND